MSLGVSHDNSKIVVQRGRDIFLVCISQLSVNNLKRLFQIGSDSDQLWLWNEANGVRYLPKEDGSFDLDQDEVRDLRVFVEVPDIDHSSGTEVHHKPARRVLNAQYRSLPPKAENRLRRIGDVIACGSSTDLHRNHADVTEEIWRQLEELRDNVGILLEMREDVLATREDVGALLTIVSGDSMQDHQALHSATA